MVRQRSAKPPFPVQIWVLPPFPASLSERRDEFVKKAVHADVAQKRIYGVTCRERWAAGTHADVAQ